MQNHKEQKFISVCIPTYEMGGNGKNALKRNFESLLNQTCRDFEVIISDNSEDNEIKNLCEYDNYKELDIKYYRNQKKGMAQNTNGAILKAKGNIIKILYMDDYLAHNDSLQNIKNNFKGYWMVTGCEHDDGEKIYNQHKPKYNTKIFLGKNTIGSPSVLSFKNEDIMLFDESMTWLLDCDYYKRLHEKYGEPTILNEINVVIGTSKYQMTSILSNKVKKMELLYMIKKYKKDLFSCFKLW